MDEMIENIIVKMLQSFEENLAEFSHQAVYIQYLFDVKYLTALLIPVENVVSIWIIRRNFFNTKVKVHTIYDTTKLTISESNKPK